MPCKRRGMQQARRLGFWWGLVNPQRLHPAAASVWGVRPSAGLCPPPDSEQKAHRGPQAAFPALMTPGQSERLESRARQPGGARHSPAAPTAWPGLAARAAG